MLSDADIEKRANDIRSKFLSMRKDVDLLSDEKKGKGEPSRRRQEATTSRGTGMPPIPPEPREARVSNEQNIQQRPNVGSRRESKTKAFAMKRKKKSLAVAHAGPEEGKAKKFDEDTTQIRRDLAKAMRESNHLLKGGSFAQPTTTEKAVGGKSSQSTEPSNHSGGSERRPMTADSSTQTVESNLMVGKTTKTEGTDTEPREIERQEDAKHEPRSSNHGPEAPITRLIKEAMVAPANPIPTQAEIHEIRAKAGVEVQPQAPVHVSRGDFDIWASDDTGLEEIVDPISDDQIDGEEIIDYWNNCCPSKPFIPQKTTTNIASSIPVRGLHSRGSSRIDENIFAVPLHHPSPDTSRQNVLRPSSSGGRGAQIKLPSSKAKVGKQSRKKFVPVTSLLKKPRQCAS